MNTEIHEIHTQSPRNVVNNSKFCAIAFTSSHYFCIYNYTFSTMNVVLKYENRS